MKLSLLVLLSFILPVSPTQGMTLGTKQQTSADGLRYALITAIVDQKEELARSILTLITQEKVNINESVSRVHDGPTAFHIATFKNMETIADELLQNHGASVDPLDDNGHTPLHIACLTENATMVTFLLARNASVHIFSRQGATPLHLASKRNNASIIHLLVNSGADVNLPDIQDHDTPLHEAAYAGADLCAKALIEHNAYIHKKNHKKISPLEITQKLHAKNAPFAQSILDANLNESRQYENIIFMTQKCNIGLK